MKSLELGGQGVKILYLCSFYHRAMIFKDSMDALVEKGNEVKVFNTTWKGDSIAGKYKPIMTPDVVHKECYYKFERYLFFSKQYKIYKELMKNFRVQNFDILHAHNLFNGGVSAFLANRKTGVPFVVSIRASDISTFIKYSFFRELANRMLKKASGIMFLSNKHKEEFFEKYVSNDSRSSFKAKSLVAFNGLESFWLKNIYAAKTLPNKKELNFLFVGKINRNKSILKVIDSIKILMGRGYNIKLTAVGKVMDRDIENTLKKYDFIEVKKFMPKEDLIKVYRDNDIFVMPSKVETFGRVYAEAMTQGLPIIYTKNQGFDGIFEDGKVGYSVPSDNATYIANCIERIALNYDIISENCIQESPRFNWKSIVKEIDAFYHKIILRRGELL